MPVLMGQSGARESWEDPLEMAKRRAATVSVDVPPVEAWGWVIKTSGTHEVVALATDVRAAVAALRLLGHHLRMSALEFWEFEALN